MRYVGDTCEFEVEGRRFSACLRHDEDMGEPWNEHDIHGIVSGWTTRDKKPGERVLSKDGSHYRYYDFAETVKLARKDGWGCRGLTGSETPKEKAAKATEADFQRMKDWCEDKWCWVYLVVNELCPCCGGKVKDRMMLVGGYESDSGEEFFKEEAQRIAQEVIAYFP